MVVADAGEATAAGRGPRLFEGTSTDPDPVAFFEFAGRPMRTVFEDEDGRQFVIDDDGENVFGVWYIPLEEYLLPVIADAPRSAAAPFSAAAPGPLWRAIP